MIPAKALKQGYFDGQHYYGELVFEFIGLSRTAKDAGGPPATGRFEVVARGGVKLRNGPGLNFDATTTLNPGTPLTVEFPAYKR